MRNNFILRMFFLWTLIFSGFLAHSMLADDAWSDFDQEDLEALELPERTETLHKNPQIDVPTIVRMLTDCDPICLQELLLNDLYQRTNTINVRSLLDSPQYYFYNCFEKNFFINLFYNQTSRGFYTIDGSTIGSYLNLGQGFLSAFNSFCPDGLDLPTIVKLIEPFKIQERRTGLMFGGRYKKNDWYFKYYFPLYYLERNLFLDDQEKARLEAALDLDTGPVSDAEGNKFAREHLITDRIGIGDTRLVFGKNIFCNKDIDLKGGAIVTIPSAFAFAKGLYGSHFLKNSAHPTLNLEQIFSMCLCPPNVQDRAKAQALFIAFGLSAIDKLTANLLDRSLGNNGHVGLGLFIEPHHKPSPETLLKGRVCLEYLFPAIEKRFFILKKNPADFNRMYNNPLLARENLNFLNQQLIETLIPCVYDTLIWPGLLIKATGQINQQFAKKWWYGGGGDLWYQTKEKFGRISAPTTTRELLKTDIAKRSEAVQAKFFGWLDYKTGKKHPWCVSFYLDGTWANFGIGKDFTLAVRFEIAL